MPYFYCTEFLDSLTWLNIVNEAITASIDNSEAKMYLYQRPILLSFHYKKEESHNVEDRFF